MGEGLNVSSYVAYRVNVGRHDGPTQGVGDDGVGGFMAASLRDGHIFVALALVPERLQSFDGGLDGLAIVLVDLGPALQVACRDGSRTSQPGNTHRRYCVRGRSAAVSHRHCCTVPNDTANQHSHSDEDDSCRLLTWRRRQSSLQQLHQTGSVVGDYT